MEARDNWKSGLGLAAACDTLPFWKCKRKKLNLNALKDYTQTWKIYVCWNKKKRKSVLIQQGTLYTKDAITCSHINMYSSISNWRSYTKSQNTFKLKINDFQWQPSTHIVSYGHALWYRLEIPISATVTARKNNID